MHDAFGALHAWLGYLLYGLFALHVAGALKHQWIDRPTRTPADVAVTATY